LQPGIQRGRVDSATRPLGLNRQAQQPEPGAPAVRTGHDLGVVAHAASSGCRLGEIAKPRRGREQLALLSNLSEAMLRATMRRNGLDTIFESVLSTDRIRAFKPAPEAYSLAISALGV
jgi:hypothetical protein